MTIRERLHAVRRVVAVALLMRTVSLAFAVAALGVLLTLAVDAVLILPRVVRLVLFVVSVGAGVVAAVQLVRRGLRIHSDESLALWIERHFPIDYLLVTATDSRYTDDAGIAARLDEVRFEPAAKAAAWRGARGPTGAAVLMAAALLIVPAPRLARIVRPAPGDVLNVADRDPASRLRPLVGRYTAPGYAGGRVETVEDPVNLRGLEGGEIEFIGPGSAGGVKGTVAGREIPAATEGRGWRILLTMPSTPAVVRLSAGAEERLVALEPVRDSVPRVTLRVPGADTVVRVARGRWPVEAVLSDDIGLTSAWFEYIVSSGSGELFQFRTGITGRRNSTGRADTLHAVLDLDSLRLGPGDILHVRAVALDAGPTSRGSGSSDTRTLRVARASESDTSAVIALPPLPSDTSALSQRMLIQLAEALQARRARIARATLLEESRSISRDQARLRREISDIIFLRLSGEAEGEERSGADTARPMTPEEVLAAAEAATTLGGDQPLDFAEDESPVVAVNRPLLEAYNAMWDATRELDVGEPGKALPHMRLALDGIQRARAAERIYLRGRAPRLVINLAQVRLSGKQDGIVTGVRVPPVDLVPRQPLDRLLAAAAMLSTDPEAARDSLLLLRVDLLTDIPAAAAQLGIAIDAIRGGSDARAALAQTRVLLGGTASGGVAGDWAGGTGW